MMTVSYTHLFFTIPVDAQAPRQMGPCGKADDCDFFRIHAVKGAVFTDMYHTFGQLAQRKQAGGRAFQFPACGAVVEDKYLSLIHIFS